MECFDFESYDFSAQPVQQQHNDPYAETTQGPLRGSRAVQTQHMFNQEMIDEFMNLSEEEQSPVLYEIPIFSTSTQADGQSTAVLGSVKLHSRNEPDVVPSQKQPLEEELLRMSNSDLATNLVPRTAASDRDLSANGQLFVVDQANTFEPSQFDFVRAEEPQISLLGEQNLTNEQFMPTDASFAQPSSFDDLSQHLSSDLQLEAASRAKKIASQEVRRRRVSISVFWLSYTTIIHPNLKIRCRGTFYELLERYPELKPLIKKQFAKWKRSIADTTRQATAHRKSASQVQSQHAVPAIGNVNYAAVMVQGGSGQQSPASPFQMPGQKIADEVLGGKLQSAPSVSSQMLSGASTPVPGRLSQQYVTFDTATGTPQSSVYLTPQSYGFHSSGYQEEYPPGSYLFQTGTHEYQEA